MKQSLVIMRLAIFVLAIITFVLMINFILKNKSIPENSQKEVTKEEPKIEPKVEEPKIPKEIKTYEDALLAAKILKKPIFLYFGAEWCPGCKDMKKMFLDEEIKEKMKEYVVLIVDVDQDKKLPTEKRLTKKFKIYSIPNYVIISNSDEQILIKDVGSKNKKDFLEWLKPKKVSLIN